MVKSICLSLSIVLSVCSQVGASFVDNQNFLGPILGYNEPLHHLKRRDEPSQTSFLSPKHLEFTHGVASGDPYHDSVILWTRLSPIKDNDASNVTVEGTVPLFSHETEEYIAASRSVACARWQVSERQDFKHNVATGQVYTTAEIDYTMKLEVKGLLPFTTYYYRFTICNSDKRSPIGRTKTAPAQDDVVSAIRLAVFSCSNFPFGFFNAVGNSARKDAVDYVVHLGDYYYEYENGDYGDGTSIGRVPLPAHETFTLYDYRKRIATYRTDADLLQSHQKFAWIPVWDDHEVSDNTWRDGAADSNNTEASYDKNGGVSPEQRRMNAVRAYFEWMPIRQVELLDNLRIWRSFSFGKLVDLIMLDTRQYDRSITDVYTNTDYVHQVSDDASRSLMGSRQENWLYRSLTASSSRGASWRLIGSQVVFSRFNESKTHGDKNPLNYDAWNGYEANRNRTLKHLYDHKINNTIFLSGDSHMNWVSDVVWIDEKKYDSRTGAGAIGVEFAGTAVSSPSPLGVNTTLRAANEVSRALVRDNPQLQWQEAFYRGYYEISVSHDQVDAHYFGLPDLASQNGLEIPLANFTVRRNANRLQRPVSRGVAYNGALRRGNIAQAHWTNDTGIASGST